jgi:uncharacterized protein
MTPKGSNPVVHLELRTPNSARACRFYTELFSWRVETARLSGASYLGFDPGCGIRAGVVEMETQSPAWLPYVEVAELSDAIERARGLGAAVALEPREGVAGWRGIIVAPGGERLALWQSKT